MPVLPVGPVAAEQLVRFGRTATQGEHVLITGPTGSGKTTLARHVVQQRIKRGGHAMVFVTKLKDDATITDEYKGWTRWKSFKKGKPASWENRVLLWPDTSRMSIAQAKAHQRAVFADAFDRLARVGMWTVQIDEGLVMCSARWLNLASPLEVLSNSGRSGKLTLVVLAQRPANLPIVLYTNASHVFAGRARNVDDQKRLAELGGRESAKELMARLSMLGRRDYLWVPVAPDWPAENFNLAS